ncbi:MAG: EamA family transporter [Candidatus Binatia bacterium]
MTAPAAQRDVARADGTLVPTAQPVRDGLIAAIAPITWGATYLAMSELLPPTTPFWFSILRGLPVGILFALQSLRLPAGIWWWRAGVLGTLNIAAAFALLFIMSNRLPGGVCGTMAATQPLLVVLIAWAVLGERPTSRKIAAAVGGFAGVALLVLGHVTRLDPIGLMAGVFQPLLNGLGTVFTQRWGRPVPLLTFTGWQLVAGSVVLLPLALIFEGAPPHLDAVNWMGLGFLAIFATGLAYFVWFRGIERLRASATSFLVLLVPLVAAALDWLLVDQRMTGLQLLGAALVLVSVFAATRPDASATAR